MFVSSEGHHAKVHDGKKTAIDKVMKLRGLQWTMNDCQGLPKKEAFE